MSSFTHQDHQNRIDRRFTSTVTTPSTSLVPPSFSLKKAVVPALFHERSTLGRHRLSDLWQILVGDLLSSRVSLSGSSLLSSCHVFQMKLKWYLSIPSTMQFSNRAILSSRLVTASFISLTQFVKSFRDLAFSGMRVRCSNFRAFCAGISFFITFLAVLTVQNK